MFIKQVIFLVVLKLLLDSVNIYLKVKFGILIPGVTYTLLNTLYLITFLTFLFSRLKRQLELELYNLIPLCFSLYLIVNAYITNHDYIILNTYIVYLIAIFLLVTKESAFAAQTQVEKSNSYLYFLFIFSFFLYLLSIDDFSLNFREVRINSFYGNANEDAGVLITLLPVFLFHLLKTKRNAAFQLCFVCFFAFILIFFNGSRYAIGGLLVILASFYYLKYKKNRYTKGLAVFVISIGLLLSFSFINEILLQTVEKINISKLLKQEGIAEDNLAGRIGGIWIPTISKTYHDSFFWGFGAGSWDKQEASIIEVNGKIINTNRAAHNTFVFNFYQFGLVGLLFIVVFYVIGIRNSYLSLKIAPTALSRDRSITIFCCWIGFFFWSFFANAWPRMSIPFLILLYSFSINNYRILVEYYRNKKLRLI